MSATSTSAKASTATTEEAIRTLLGSDAPPASGLADDSPHGLLTPESYLGYQRLARNGGEAVEKDAEHTYRLPAKLGDSELAFGGGWKVEDERAVAGAPREAHGSTTAPATSISSSPGRARCECSSTASRSARCASPATGSTRSSSARRSADHLLELHFSPGVAGYAFTFG